MEVRWRKVAERLGRSWLGRRIVPEAWAALREDEAAGRPWLVACSGGADSVALLLWVWARFPAQRGRLRVGHFNHGVRGAAADADAAWVGGLAEALGVDLVVGRRAAAGRAGEEELRRGRLAFLREEAAHDGARVLTGHHADDLLEHFLLRLARGSGAEGLAGLRPAGRGPGFDLARPLLGFTREEVRYALAAAGGTWREDATNAEPGAATRNRLRAEVVPAWRAAVPQDLATAADRARRRLAEEAEAVAAWLATLPGAPVRGAVSWEASPLRGLPVALFRRRLLAWLADLGLADRLKAGAADRLVEAWTDGRAAVVTVGPGCAVTLGRDGRVALRGARDAKPAKPAKTAKTKGTRGGPKGT